MTKLLAMLTLAAALALPSSGMANPLLDADQYPAWERARLIATCQGLEAESRESLTTVDRLDEESGDPASDWQLSSVPFTLKDCKAAGLI